MQIKFQNHTSKSSLAYLTIHSATYQKYVHIITHVQYNIMTYWFNMLVLITLHTKTPQSEVFVCSGNS